MFGNLTPLLLFVLFSGCTLPPDRAAARNKIVLSDAQVDSLRQLDNQVVTRSLWQAFKPEPDFEYLPVIHWLSGNLDSDEEPEAVVWYFDTVGLMGAAGWLDRRDGRWQVLAELRSLDFWHGRNPPRIDPDIPALIVYGYGSGSGFGSSSLNFWQYRDTLVQVLDMIEQEWLSMNGGPASRSIDGNYRLVGDSSIIVHYRYEVICTEEGKHYEDRIFKAELDIPFFRNPENGVFEVRPPPGLSAADFGAFWDGETTFDPYFGPQLEQIRRKGPKWKRQALGYWGDE